MTLHELPQDIEEQFPENIKVIRAFYFREAASGGGDKWEEKIKEKLLIPQIAGSFSFI